MRVHLFIPCLIDQFHPETGVNVVRILEKTGAEVIYPENQICCGQPFFKSGHWKKAVPLAKNTIKAFENSEFVVGPSGSCVKMIKHHYMELFSHDHQWLGRAEELSSRIYEFSEFLVKIGGATDLGALFKKRVTYHDSCQVARGLGIRSEPRVLLRNVKDLEFVEMENSDFCCGFGGIFSFRSPHIADAIVAQKVYHIQESGAEIVTGCEISCLMHIDSYCRRNKIAVRAVHLADILASGI
ncbi:(Fe-S)-binding protein [Thermodesulfobacteriota bacterium]